MMPVLRVQLDCGVQSRPDGSACEQILISFGKVQVFVWLDYGTFLRRKKTGSQRSSTGL